MGFYDARCMITGISLHGIDATLVVLRRAGEAYEPITLGITGTYDRYGSVDGTEPDVNTDLILAYFRGQRRDGTFVVTDSFPSIGDVEDLLRFFERNNQTLEPDPPLPSVTATWAGQPPFVALIAQPIWDAVTAPVRADEAVAKVWFDLLCGRSPMVSGIYQDRVPDVSEQVRQLYLVDDFRRANQLAWAPAAESAEGRYSGFQYQHDADDMREFLAEARTDFAGVRLIRAALDRYETESLLPFLSEFE